MISPIYLPLFLSFIPIPCDDLNLTYLLSIKGVGAVISGWDHGLKGIREGKNLIYLSIYLFHASCIPFILYIQFLIARSSPSSFHSSGGKRRLTIPPSLGK